MPDEPVLAERIFPKPLYVGAAIREALEVYAGLAELRLTERDDAWVVELLTVDEDFTPDVVASELANYVLAGTVERKR